MTARKAQAVIEHTTYDQQVTKEAVETACRCGRTYRCGPAG
jgi:hypothetical protein